MSARSFFFQAPLQSNVVSIVEKKCSEAREAGSAHSAMAECPLNNVWHPLVPPDSIEISPGAICSP